MFKVKLDEAFKQKEQMI